MSAKFVLRTFRNVVFRDRPYFAHLTVTHRGDGRRRLRRGPRRGRGARPDELDTEGMKQVVDVLDRMGVAVSSTGARVYVADSLNNRVQYFKDTEYAVTPTSLGRVKALFK